MRYASVLHEGRRFAAVIEGELAIPVSGIEELGALTPLPVLRSAQLDRGAAVSVADVRLLPVIPHPGKVICVGLNYRAHVEETGRELPSYPVLFPKFATSLIGAQDAVALPPESEAVDYEGELAVVIGARARRVAERDALGVVAGYTVANDVTMRDYQARTTQFLPGKTWDDSTPIGPVLVSTDEIPDPSALTLHTAVNGVEVQRASTSLMIFDVPRLIATISEFLTLEPGDVILTGTPEGVGFRREPPLLLHDGDVVSVAIDGIGELRNPVRAEQVG